MMAALIVATTVKASIVAASALAFIVILRRGSAVLRHTVLLSALVCVAAVPVLGVVVPAWHLPVSSTPAWSSSAALRASSQTGARAAIDRSAIAAVSSRSEGTSAVDVSTILVSVWIVGAAVAILILIAGLARLAWLVSHARPIRDGQWPAFAEEISRRYRLRAPVRILQSDHPSLLVTFGVWRPAIVLPVGADGWTDERIRVVLGHELAHIARRDWLAQLFVELVRAVHWFNPFVRMACTRARLESERAADDAVLELGVGAPDYAAQLVELARTFSERRTWLPAPAIARPSTLERRITAMLNNRLDRSPLTRSARILSIVAPSIVAVAVASAQGAFATFSGSLLDSQNGVLPNATLVLTNQQSKAKYEIQSDRTGHFEFVGLPMGDYTFQASLPGFSTLNGTLQLTGGNVQRNMTMQVGMLHETVVSRQSAPPAPVAHSSSATQIQTESCPGFVPGGIGGNIKAPRKLVHVAPQFPASQTGSTGLVVLDARIGTDGRVADIRTVSATAPEFEAAARDAVGQWQFSQTLLNCAPIEVSMQATLRFEP